MARQEQGKAAAWWLGEYGNVACGEVVGSAQEASSVPADQPNGRLASPMEQLALQASLFNAWSLDLGSKPCISCLPLLALCFTGLRCLLINLIAALRAILASFDA